MKYVYEASDIYGGMCISGKSHGSALMIGYDPTLQGARNKNDWCIIALSDGMILQSKLNADQVASYLTETDLKPIDNPLRKP